MLTGQARNIIRQFSTSIARRGNMGGVPGENLPFDIYNKYKLTLTFILFFGSGLAVPFVMVRHQLLKKAT